MNITELMQLKDFSIVACWIQYLRLWSTGQFSYLCFKGYYLDHEEAFYISTSDKEYATL